MYNEDIEEEATYQIESAECALEVLLEESFSILQGECEFDIEELESSKIERFIGQISKAVELATNVLEAREKYGHAVGYDPDNRDR